MKEKKENLMREIRVEKVTVNMGVGQTGEELKKGQEILEKITGRKTIQTLCKIRQPLWNIREGLPIGAKVTLRKQKAMEFLKTALGAKDNQLNKKNFDVRGNLGFGIKEYIDLPGVKYDPKLGVKGFDVLVTLERKGFRIKKRKLKQAKISKSHSITREEAIEFLEKKFGVEVIG